MNIKLLHHTPLEVADIAISKCYNKKPYEALEKQQARINKVANVSKHSSTIEHLVYSFDIDGISRAVLQELARHRIASYTVKSTRYTLKELKDEQPFQVWSGNENGTTREEELERVKKYCVLHPNGFVDDYEQLGNALSYISQQLRDGRPADRVKYMLPEAYKTALVMTINARALQNFLALRTDSHALWEIQDLARAMFEELPEEHKFMFKDSVSTET